jgi:hypothetical protein
MLTPISQYDAWDNFFLLDSLFPDIEPLDTTQSARSPGAQMMKELADTVSQTLSFRISIPMS